MQNSNLRLFKRIILASLEPGNSSVQKAGRVLVEPVKKHIFRVDGKRF
jgi:hypothetical protein